MLRGGAVVAGVPVVDDPAVGSVLEEAELAAVVPLVRLGVADPHAAVSAPTPRAPAATIAATPRRRVSRAVVRDIDVHLANGSPLGVPEHLSGREPLITVTVNQPDYTAVTPRSEKAMSAPKSPLKGHSCSDDRATRPRVVTTSGVFGRN